MMDEPKTKSERTKERIYQEAFKLFEFHGFKKTTIPMICEAADVSRSTFFHYFESKSDILSDFRFAFAANIEKKAASFPAEMPGREKVRELLMFDAGQNLERGAALRRAIISSLANDPEFSDSDVRTLTALPPIYSRILAESNPDAPKEKCDRVAKGIVRMYWEIWRECVLLRMPVDFKKELNDAFDLLWDGIDLQ